MTVTASNYKFYQATSWVYASTGGGTINTSGTITTNTLSNIFATVTNEQRLSGTTLYRKIFMKNEDATQFPAAKAYISASSPSTYSQIWITSGTAGDFQSAATSYSFVQPYSVGDASALSFGTVAIGDSATIWVKLVVASNSLGYDANTFTITVNDTY
jgi:hypothetical protein